MARGERVADGVEAAVGVGVTSGVIGVGGVSRYWLSSLSKGMRRS
jgi:hypothetical protein